MEGRKCASIVRDEVGKWVSGGTVCEHSEGGGR